jgi:hypothetical protein
MGILCGPKTAFLSLSSFYFEIFFGINALYKSESSKYPS